MLKISIRGFYISKEGKIMEKLMKKVLFWGTTSIVLVSQSVFAKQIECRDIKLLNTIFVECEDAKQTHGGQQVCGTINYVMDFIPKVVVNFKQDGTVTASMTELNEYIATELACDIDPFAPLSNNRICKFEKGVQIDVLDVNGQDLDLVFFGKGSNSPSARVQASSFCITK